MSFAGLNYLAILAAAIAGFAVGAVWYTALSRPWQRLAAVPPSGSPAPFAVSAVSLLVMAWVLAGVVGHLGPGQVTPRNGLISAAFLWTGLVLTTTATSYAFARRPVLLIAIDAGHWLAVLLVMGAVIGVMGV